MQGDAGQWWWHYDVRTGGVVEDYPVYSVHQHAMAPMVLLDLREAGGVDHVPAIARGLAWLRTHPETRGELLDDRSGVIWRKVGRREPRKAVRYAAVGDDGGAPVGCGSPAWTGCSRPAASTTSAARTSWAGCCTRGWPAAWRPAPGRPPASRCPSPSARLYGLLLDPITMDEVLARCDRALDERQRLLIGVVNAAKVVKLRRDDVLRDSLLECDVLLADGQSVVWASRLLGQPLPERVAGVDLFERLLERAAAGTGDPCTCSGPGRTCWRRCASASPSASPAWTSRAPTTATSATPRRPRSRPRSPRAEPTCCSSA